MRHFDRITLSSFINFNDMNLHLNFNDPNYEFALAGALLHYKASINIIVYQRFTKLFNVAARTHSTKLSIYLSVKPALT